MPNTPQRLVRPSSRNLLSCVLDQPDLPAQIQSLAPTVFGKLIERIGLEDAGELVAMATTEQLGDAFDEDLWKNQRPGEEERFDADRFLLWLEVLLEAGDAFAASRLVEMPEELVTLALHKHVLVLDVEALSLDMQSADEVDARQLDKALESCLYEELNGFQLMARDCDGWDAILSLVLALDRDHHEFLSRILERCCAMSSEYIEDNGGLFEVLTSEEVLEADLAGEREDRRAEAGHVAPSSAAAFLSLARKTEGVSGERDPMTRAYFRNLRPTQQPLAHREKVSGGRLNTGRKAKEPDGLSELLRDAGVLVEASPQYLLTATTQPGDLAESRLSDAMRSLAERDPVRYGERSEELAYLTNVLLAGCSIEQRSLRPLEAVRVAIATCNLGLCMAISGPPSVRQEDVATEALAVLRQRTADELFRCGWQRIHQDVVDVAAKVALRLFELAASKRSESVVRKACEEGAPWRGLSVLDDLLRSVDGRDVDTLRGLMDQCPRLAVPRENVPSSDGENRRLSAPRYLSTPAVLDESRRFLDYLVEQPGTARSKRDYRLKPDLTEPAAAKPGRLQVAPNPARRAPKRR
jgi:hypothetical protein